MITLIIFLLILCSILLVTVVLMQSSKGNGLAGPIGGSSVTMAFGVRRTSDLLTRATTVLAAILMVGCIVVNLMITNTGAVNESIIQKNAGQQQQQMPPPNTAPPIENNQPPANNQDQQQNNNMPPPPPPVLAYFVAVSGQQTGPFDIMALSQMVKSGSFNKESLVWKQGMAGWSAAGQMQDLSQVFNSVPPPIPG